MKREIRALSIILALVLLICVAVLAGIGLAIWDTGSSISEVSALMFPADDSEEMETQTITISDGQITDVLGQELVTQGNVDHPITDEIAGGISTPELSTNEGGLKELTEKGGIKSEINGDTKQEEPIDIDAFIDKIEEEKPLQITSEISGISTIVRAGDTEDVLTNSLPAPAQITASEEDSNIDPLADYPLPYQEVDNSYFDDALFIGDSRVAGLAMASGTNATFYAVTSFQLYKYKTFKVVQTPNGKVPIFDAMPYDRFTKIYIKVGLNELGSVTDEPFLNEYTNLINDLRAMQPRAIIYIQAILPVTQVKSQTDRVHCNENIRKRNENLKSFAEVMKCYFVDVGPYFADESGALKAETTADGIHMYGRYMPQWIDALRKNAVIWPPSYQPNLNGVAE